MKTANSKSKIENGFICLIVYYVVYLLKILNLVEWFKKGAVRLVKKESESDKKMIANLAIDIFIVLKVVLVVLSVLFDISGRFMTFLIIYLLFMNLFTYFYYHVWIAESIDTPRMRRRFISLTCAIIFNILCFIYLFYSGLSDSVKWSSNFSKIGLQDIGLYCIANTFMISTHISVANRFGYYLQTLQQLTSFIFLAIILSQSIPTNPSKDKED